MVLHPTDFLGYEDGQGLSIIPGMSMSVEDKLPFLHEVLTRLKAAFSVVTVREHAIEAASEASFAALSPVI
jgi:hypothetical protein